MESRYKRLGKNTALVFIGGAGSKLITLLMLPYYTRMLSTSAYGVSDLIYTYASIMVSVISCCLADAIFIFPKNADDEGRKKYFTSGVVFSIISFAVWAVIALIIDHSNVAGTIHDYVWWIYGLTFSFFLQGYLQQFCLSIDRVAVFSVTGIVLVACIAGFAFLLMPKYGLTGYLLSIIIANLVASVFAFITSGAYSYFSLNSISKTHLQELLKYGIPVIPNTIMWWIVNGINRPIMEVNLGLDAIGIYAVANKLPAVLTMIFALFSNAWNISMLEEFGKADFNQFFNKTARILFFMIFISAVILILCSKIIVSIFAAPEFFEAWRYVPVLTIGIVLSCLSGLVGGVFAAEKKSKYFFYSSIWGAATSLIFTVLGVKFWGIMGVCIAVAISFLCMVIVRLKFAWTHIYMFDIKYYVFMLLLIICESFIMIVSHSNLITIMATLIILVVMYLLNRDVPRGLLQLVRNRITRK